ncbi:hypothetical protein OGAPHI_001675 [Ogataea philodendri]|uniref:Uncharacterized protein n=1 Tax=Ogataea philodendri TaxID=1378263 RepID=A0A9P8T824_9ASCO|nr:uncharacterized protein OGAPHI_001675 [Ogataea philodendri]KAH3669079.1 hypothetical protein OGAPHI_001675 [Ogataea philodendri]
MGEVCSSSFSLDGDESGAEYSTALRLSWTLGRDTVCRSGNASSPSSSSSKIDVVFAGVNCGVLTTLSRFLRTLNGVLTRALSGVPSFVGDGLRGVVETGIDDLSGGLETRGTADLAVSGFCCFCLIALRVWASSATVWLCLCSDSSISWRTVTRCATVLVSSSRRILTASNSCNLLLATWYAWKSPRRSFADSTGPIAIN